MIEPRITRRYVQGFIQAAHEKDCVGEVEQVLKNVDRIIKQEQSIKDILGHPVISREHKKKIFRRLIGEEAPETLQNFVDYVIDKKREGLLEFLYDEYRKAADTLRGILRAKIKSAAALTGAQVEKLRGELEKKLGKKVELECEVDKILVGGLQIFVGTYIIDGSVSGRLNRLQKHLLNINKKGVTSLGT